MIRKNDIKNKPLILYEKYKKDHQITLDTEKYSSLATRRKSPVGVIGNLFITGILIGMIFLSSVGVITLMNPELKEIFVQIVTSDDEKSVGEVSE